MFDKEEKQGWGKGRQDVNELCPEFKLLGTKFKQINCTEESLKDIGDRTLAK